MSADMPVLLYRREGAIAHIRFNRPAVLNAIDAAMAAAFLEACQQVAAIAEIRVVVLSGEGRSFMAGGDVAQFSSPEAIASDLIEPMHQGLELLSGLSALVIASIRGSAVGAGMSLALFSDYAIAADNAKFNFAYTKLATSCDLGASWHLPRLVGLRRALEIALLSAPINAGEALRLGIVNRVVPVAELEQETMRLAEQLSAGPSFAMGQIKHLMRSALDNNFPNQLAAEKDAFQACAATRDFADAVRSFVTKSEAY